MRMFELFCKVYVLKQCLFAVLTARDLDGVRKRDAFQAKLFHVSFWLRRASF